jgi:hypothetical protein
MDVELSAVASVLLKIPKDAQRPYFDLKHVLLGRVLCIPKSETFRNFTGLPARWSEVLLVCVLRPVLARELAFWAKRLIWVVSLAS